MDRPWGKSRRGFILCVFLLILIVSFITLWIQNSVTKNVTLTVSIIFLVLIGISMTGPYAISAVFTLELGGKKGSATLSGLTDAVGK